MENGQNMLQTVANTVENTMENERFELKTVAHTVEMAVSSSKMLQIAWKMVRTGNPKKIPQTFKKQFPKQFPTHLIIFNYIIYSNHGCNLHKLGYDPYNYGYMGLYGLNLQARKWSVCFFFPVDSTFQVTLTWWFGLVVWKSGKSVFSKYFILI